jgi:hypothetical protein
MVYLIVTTQNNTGGFFSRFINSLNRQNDRTKQKFTAVIVNQCEQPIDERELQFVYKIVNTAKCSLSAARNIGLREIADGECVIGFPDDDCWYNDTVLEKALKLFDESWDFISTGVFDEIRQLPYIRHSPMNYRKELAVKNICLPVSVGIFVKQSFKGEIVFDERFSAGAQWGSGEETDLLLELLYRKKKGVYDSFDFVCHEIDAIKPMLPQRYYKYAVGFGALAAKSVYARGQRYMLKHLRWLKFKSFVAEWLFLCNYTKRQRYISRLQGLKDGWEQGKAAFHTKAAKG